MRFLKAPTIPSILLSMLKTNGSGDIVAASANADFLFSVQSTSVQGRLTLVSGLPVTTADVSGGTLYWTPFNGGTIPLWNTSTSNWEVQTFSEQTLTLAGLTTDKPHDIFASNNNNGTFTITATAWTNNSTRATALVLQNGVYCLTGSLGKRYLGTIYVSGSSTTSDTIGARWVWNQYNRVLRKLECGDTNNASYTLVGAVSGTWQFNRNSAGTSQCYCIIGLANEPIWISTSNYAVIPSGGVYVGAGVNISFNSAVATATISNGFRIGGTSGGIQSGGFINTNYIPPVGMLALTQLEYAENGTITFFPGASTSGVSQRSAITALTWG